MRFNILILVYIVTLSGLNAQSVYDFQLKTPEGVLTKYSDVKGENLTIIDFWATWCKPCVNSIPELVKISDAYYDKGVQFIGLSIDSPRNLSKIRPFTESVGIKYPVLLDLDQDVLRDFNVSVIPTLVIVDKNDEIVYLHEGFAPGDQSEIIKEIDRLLNENQ